MKKVAIFLFFSVLFGCAKPNNEIEETPTNFQDNSAIFQVVERQPEFEGGLDELTNFFQKNLVYPEQAKKVGANGKVFVTFVVEKDGSITNVEILKGLGFGCDEEALRVMKLMPNWKPGRQSGAAVRVKYNLPIRFALE